MTIPAATEYERFVGLLPEDLRAEFEERLGGSRLSPDNPLFGVLADIFSRATKGQGAEEGEESSVPDFLQEATLHSTLSKQLLEQFKSLPEELHGKIEAHLGSIEKAARPLTELSAVADQLSRHVEHLAAVFPIEPAPPEGDWRERSAWRVARIARVARQLVMRLAPWAISGTVCAAGSVIATTLILYFGAIHLRSYYEDQYHRRVAELETDSIQDTVTLNRLVEAGISIELRRNESGDGYFLVLKGVKKAAQPVNSPDGLAVQVWP